MAIILEIDNGDGRGRVNYTPFLVSPERQPMVLRDRMNLPTLLDFTVVPAGEGFQAPRRSACVRLSGFADAPLSGGPRGAGALFTGFITNEPTTDFLGVLNGRPLHGYRCEATSEEYLLNVKRVGILPPFLNQTAGQILRFLTTRLQPGRFDVSQVAEGALVPLFQINPEQGWSDVARELADRSGFYYRVLDGRIYFQPVGDLPAGARVDEADKNFRPDGLEITPLGNPIHNDVTVFGGIEPQATYQEHFVGDGFTSRFVLSAPVYGSESSRLLVDDFTGNSIDAARWQRTSPQNVISAFQGRLNVTGGNGSLGENTLLAYQAVELGGELELVHGEFEFIAPSTGIVGGLYAAPSLAQADCLSGFDVSPLASSARIRALIAGLAQAPEVVVQANRHYVLVTRLSSEEKLRSQLSFPSSDSTFGGGVIPAVVRVRLEAQEIDLANPAVPAAFVLYESPLTLLPPFALYAPINSADLHVACNFLQITRPIQARLTTQKSGELPKERTLGFGIAGQDATITHDQSQNQWALEFYEDTIPARGEKITVRYRGAGRAQARVQDPISMASEASLAGDDGMRAVVLEEVTPLPRSSSEAEFAAQAYLADHAAPRYEGRYSTWGDFAEAFPRSGRILEVRSESRHASFSALVRSVTSEIHELSSEKILHTLEFGQPSRFEDLLQQFRKPDRVLRAEDEVPPLPIEVPQIGTTYIGGVTGIALSGVSSAFYTLDLGSPPPANGTYQVRRGDQGWNAGTLPGTPQNLVGVFTSQTFLLPRTARNQAFFLRPVSSSGQTSRFSTALVIHYPLIPVRPQAVQVIYGEGEQGKPLIEALVEISESSVADVDRVELRDSDNSTVLGVWDFGQLQREGQIYRVRHRIDNSASLLRAKTLFAYTQNVLGEYSTQTTGSGAQLEPTKPSLALGNAVGQVLEILLDRVAGQILETQIQAAAPGQSFTTPAQDARFPGQPEKFSFVATRSGAWTFRARRRDTLGWSPWSDQTQGQVPGQVFIFNVEFFQARELDPSVGAAVNSQNLLPNSEFFLQGIGGQEGARVARYFALVNAAPSGSEVDYSASSNEMQWKSGVTFTQVNPGFRSLLTNLGRLFNPGEPVTLSAALRHNGTGAFGRPVRFALRSASTPSYDQSSGLPVGRVLGNYQWLSVTFRLPAGSAVPTDLTAEITTVISAGQSLASALFCDKVVLNRGHRPAAFSLALWDVAPLAWNASAGAYELPATSVAAEPRASDPGNAGLLAGTGTEDLDPDFTARYFRVAV